MKQQKIVLIGAPGSGKTSIMKTLEKRGFCCKQEISRQVILEAKEKGIDQLFLKDPLLFSKILVESRERQFIEASKKNEKLVFFDRGIPDVTAYLDFFNTKFPEDFSIKNTTYIYDMVFYFPPWKEIYQQDNERYESFEEAKKIDEYLLNTYNNLGYSIIKVPFDSIESRTDFILNSLKSE
ncbi:ATP-binding protein [Polaribacter sp.]|nr:ATP-binding protein [Polaribacter sp.]